MNAGHALQHVHELRERVRFLQPLRADGPAYKLWLGDLVELANTIWGTGSEESRRIASVLREEIAEGESDPTRRYLRRLERLDAVLQGYERQLGTPA